MDTRYQYRTLARWPSGPVGFAEADCAHDAIHFSAPPEFGGAPGYWTPEHLLLAALAGCFAATFRAIARHSNFEYADLQVEVEGTVSKAESGYRFSEIIFHPRLIIQDEGKRDRALSLLQKTKTGCLVSKALSFTPALGPHIAIENVVSTR
jgi:organic hydroperoxide reductase OsmC/OhrA